jgi:REase associating with pPIWI_RE/pPIWI_RE three-gene island domain Y
MVRKVKTHTDEEEPLGSLSQADNIELPSDILILHFIATGVIQLSERIARGVPVDSHYPIPLQIGLNRLNVIRYRHSLPLIRSVPDLLSWCRRPLKEWSLDIALGHLDPDDTLLDNQFPTDQCEALACVTSDIEADLSERRFMSAVFNACQTTNSPGTYVTFRRLLIEHPVLTEFELIQQRNDYPELNILTDHLKVAYDDAPLDYMLRGQFYCCPICGNLQQPTVQMDRLLCEEERCRRQHMGKPGRVIPAREHVLWLKRGLRRFVTLPGLAEVRLEQQLLKLKLHVDLWPDFDSYDLRVEFPDGKAWAVDVKDWANPFLLALNVKNIPLRPPLERGYFVFPDERASQADYVRAFRNACNSRRSSGKVIIGGSIQAKFERHFLADVKKRLADCKGGQ